MTLFIGDRIDQGQFADIFAPAPGNRAIKLFRRASTRELGVVHSIWKREVLAYEVAHTHPELKQYLPEFYGTVAVERVEDRRGRNLGKRYWLEFGYSMERLKADPKYMKLGSLYDTPDWQRVAPMERAFSAAGIRISGTPQFFTGALVGRNCWISRFSVPTQYEF